MRLLITGGCGFIGANFILYILKKYPNHMVTNLDKLTYAANLNTLKHREADPNYSFVEGDICDSTLVSTLVPAADVIVHFAAESHVDRSLDNTQEFLNTNIMGTHVLLETARINNTRFHHISTDEIFGSISEGFCTEQSPIAPSNPYAASKAAAHHLVNAYHHTYNLPITISICTNNYGPYQFPEKMIPLFISNLLQNQQLPIYGDGTQIRDWLHVHDHCRAIDLIIHHGQIGQTYCVGGSTQLSNLQVTHKVLDHLQKDQSWIQHVPDRQGHDIRYALDSSKVKEELGWEPKINFTEGLAQTIQWYKQNTWWWQPLKEKQFAKFEAKKRSILILGAQGMLGRDLCKAFKHFHLKTVTKTEVDITNKHQIQKIITQEKPNIVINAAAYTNVDGCQTNTQHALLTNGHAPGILAQACSSIGATLLQISTDYVFCGTKEGGYDESDIPSPINMYGTSKFAGEKNVQSKCSRHYIIRTSWLFGKTGKNFVQTMLNLAQTRSEIRVVHDQYGCPTYTKDLAQAIKELIEDNAPYGIYHLTNQNSCSWYEFATKVLANDNCTVHPIPSSDYPTPTKRPMYSHLLNTKRPKLRPWQQALEEYLNQ